MDGVSSRETLILIYPRGIAYHRGCSCYSIILHISEPCTSHVPSYTFSNYTLNFILEWLSNETANKNHINIPPLLRTHTYTQTHIWFLTIQATKYHPWDLRVVVALIHSYTHASSCVRRLEGWRLTALLPLRGFKAKPRGDIMLFHWTCSFERIW